MEANIFNCKHFPNINSIFNFNDGEGLTNEKLINVLGINKLNIIQQNLKRKIWLEFNNPIF